MLQRLTDWLAGLNRGRAVINARPRHADRQAHHPAVSGSAVAVAWAWPTALRGSVSCGGGELTLALRSQQRDAARLLQLA